MKNLFYFFAFVLITGSLVSCEKDEMTIASPVGDWELTDIHADDGVSTVTSFGFVQSYTYTLSGKDYNAVVTFTENPNRFAQTGEYTAVTTTNINGVMNTVEIVVPDYMNMGSWEINGDQFTQQIDGQDPETFTILELSSTKLRLRWDLDVTFMDSGATVNNKATVFTTFERI